MTSSVEYEAEIEAQLVEQRAALTEIAALGNIDEDGSMREVQEQLKQGIQELEQALLDMKRNRLLADLQGMQDCMDPESSSCMNPLSSTAAPARGAVGSCSGSDGGDPEDDDDSDSGSGDDAYAVEHVWTEDLPPRRSDSDADCEDDDIGRGLGSMLAHARSAAAAGPQTETAHFADWEGHSRGIASKLLARMGYIKGTGLGRTGAGMLSAVEVVVRPERLGLGGIDTRKQAGDKVKKKKRGGERARRKKFAQAARDSKSAALDQQQRVESTSGAPGLFAFINNALGPASEANAHLSGPQYAAAVENGTSGARRSSGGGGATSATAAVRGDDDRRILASQQDNVAAAQVKVKRLKEMLGRNRANKPLAVQIQSRLDEATAELRAAQATQSRMHKSISSSEAQKKWLKF